MKTFAPLQNLMQKRMSRRDFLKHVLAIVVAMIGIKAFIQLLIDPQKKLDGIHTERVIEKHTVEKVSQGYGNTPYGV